MTSPYEMFKPKKIDQQTPASLDYGDFKITIKYGGTGNNSFSKAAQIKLKPFERRDAMANAGKLSDEAKDALDKQKAKALAELYADFVIIGWDGVKDESGKEMKYNRDNVIKLLTDIPDLFTDIVNQAMDSANFKTIEEEDEEKNSPKS